VDVLETVEAKQVAAGGDFTVVLTGAPQIAVERTSDFLVAGEVITFGANTSGQLG
jgi:hypothetical protein